ncbi:uncharacterized protein LOC122558272 [Chiloscyllium plagiosum]|uniref:uncharacterized protein LOC122558272 n=1 Tax=Chiloscyllium plagiosum TaxID=36176 RepID=UPI001CB7C480|nr:uncharacterized protein LOC122558272 [Chiloscyllium plagiosum]
MVSPVAFLVNDNLQNIDSGSFRDSNTTECQGRRSDCLLLVMVTAWHSCGSNGTSQVPLCLPGTKAHLRGSPNQPDPFLLLGSRAHPAPFIRLPGSPRSVYPAPGLTPLRLSGSLTRLIFECLTPTFESPSLTNVTSGPLAKTKQRRMLCARGDGWVQIQTDGRFPGDGGYESRDSLLFVPLSNWQIMPYKDLRLTEQNKEYKVTAVKNVCKKQGQHYI